MWQFPPFRLDVANQIPYRGDVRIPVMPNPFSILQDLVEHAGCLVTRDELVSAIWPETHVQPETPRFIETITKCGYRRIGEVTAIEPKTTDHIPVTRKLGARAILATIAILATGLPAASP